MHKTYSRNSRIQKTLVLLLLVARQSDVQSLSPVVSAFVRNSLSNTELQAKRWPSLKQRRRVERKIYQPNCPTTYSEDEDEDDINNTPTSDIIIADNSLADDIKLPNIPDNDDSESSTSARSTTNDTVDLTGSWKIVVDDAFLQQYQDYLTLLGQPFWVRSIALSIVSRTTEETKQTGDALYIKGTNVRGTWERTLVSTAAAVRNNATLMTADGETVQYEAWWEGPVHVSWLRGVQKYGGGSFESRRYLKENINNNNKYLVCESTFHPDDPNRETANVTWAFEPESQ